jgi:hypothetical protein
MDTQKKWIISFVMILLLNEQKRAFILLPLLLLKSMRFHHDGVAAW